MRNYFYLSLLALSLVGCDQAGTHKNTHTDKVDRNERMENTTIRHDKDFDNTEYNIRDRDHATKTPINQSESEADRTITQRIRKALMADDSLSTNAKNIKIITIEGVVTLRGPVANSSEKEIVEKKAHDVQGIVRIDNQLEVLRNNHN